MSLPRSSGALAALGLACGLAFTPGALAQEEDASDGGIQWTRSGFLRLEGALRMTNDENIVN